MYLAYDNLLKLEKSMITSIAIFLFSPSIYHCPTRVYACVRVYAPHPLTSQPFNP